MVTYKLLKVYPLLFLILSFQVSAQHRYAVHYKYKPTTTYSLDNPETFLLDKAVDRRLREQIAVDSTDLPVSVQYIDKVGEIVDGFIFHSKWLNASLIMADESIIPEIEAFPFVEKVELVARGGVSHIENSKKESGEALMRIRSKLFKKSQTFDFQNDILGIPEMHAEGYNGEGLRIAVFDAGFMNADQISGMQHLFENDKIIATRDFVIPGSDNVFRTDTHGTGSLSLLASNDPQKLVAGAYAAEYILCITEDVQSEYRIEEYNWVRAAEFADSLGVDIINSSLGYNIFDDPAMNYTKEQLDGETSIASIGAGMAADKGILVVCSTGNEGNISWKTITVPADAKGILSVGAISNDFQKAGFSSIGPSSDGRIKPELVAFGTGVTIWRFINGPSFSSGTSFSSPQIAALAAGIWQARPDWTRAELKENILKSGSQYEEPDYELGYGIPNFRRALYGTINEIEEGREHHRTKIYPNPLDGNKLFVEFGNASQCNFRLFDTAGKQVSFLSLARNLVEDPYEVDLRRVNPGIYLIELQDNDGAKVIKLLRK